MDSLIQFGIELIIQLQGLGTWLEGPMRAFTFLGSEEFFLLFLPVVYWCVDSAVGIRIAVIILVTGSLNDILKLTFHGPRPYWASSQVKALAWETSFGLPSNHAQVAMGLWGMLAFQAKRWWAWGVALAIALLVGFSRLYLGVHFPHDVVVGWLLGGTILWIFISWWEPVVAWIQKKSLGQQIGLALALSVLVLVTGTIVFSSLGAWELPAEWASNAAKAGQLEPIAPITLSYTITAAAVLFGLLAGLAWLHSQGGFDVSGSFWQRGGRFLVGVLGILVLWYVLGKIFPREEAFLSYSLRYLRYTLVGLWISAGAPWLFIRLKLAQKAQA